MGTAVAAHGTRLQATRVFKGTANEEIVMRVLEEVTRCKVSVRYKGVQSVETSLSGQELEHYPDILLSCPDGDKLIEMKESVLFERATDRESGFRVGRFALSKEVTPKDCYAMTVDDPVTNMLAIDFVKPDFYDGEIQRLQSGKEVARRGGANPKVSVLSVLDQRAPENRCFLDVGTVIVDHGDFKKMQENLRRKKLGR